MGILFLEGGRGFLSRVGLVEDKSLRLVYARIARKSAIVKIRYVHAENVGRV